MTATGPTLYHVEHTQPPSEGRRYTANHATWVLIDGDALDAAAAIRAQHPDHSIVKVIGHGRGRAVLIVPKPDHQGWEVGDRVSLLAHEDDVFRIARLDMVEIENGRVTMWVPIGDLNPAP